MNNTQAQFFNCLPWKIHTNMSLLQKQLNAVWLLSTSYKGSTIRLNRLSETVSLFYYNH